MKKTQKQIVWEKLRNDGEITNLWAIQNQIWRLGAVIKVLRDEGKEIDGDFLPGSKNFQYTINLAMQPKRFLRVEVRDGVAYKIFG